jgi:hypothetical protein
MPDFAADPASNGEVDNGINKLRKRRITIMILSKTFDVQETTLVVKQLLG